MKKVKDIFPESKTEQTVCSVFMKRRVTFDVVFFNLMASVVSSFRLDMVCWNYRISVLSTEKSNRDSMPAMARTTTRPISERDQGYPRKKHWLN
jgi:hypothetical protein